MKRIMTGRSLRRFTCILTVLLSVTSLAISPAYSAPPKKDVGGQGKPNKGGKKNFPPKLSGTPDGTVLENTFYEFAPDAYDKNGDVLTFAINNKPGWADFDPTTGALYGTPTAAHVGHYDSIQISASDGRATVQMPAFAIDVTSVALNSATLNWLPPTENTDGTSLTDLAGFRIYYGVDSQDLNNVVDIPNPGVTSYVVDNLTPDTWYFAATAYTSGGMESLRSSTVNHDLR